MPDGFCAAENFVPLFVPLGFRGFRELILRVVSVGTARAVPRSG
jgi:hypothetical protein